MMVALFPTEAILKVLACLIKATGLQWHPQKGKALGGKLGK